MMIIISGRILRVVKWYYTCIAGTVFRVLRVGASGIGRFVALTSNEDYYCPSVKSTFHFVLVLSTFSAHLQT